MNQAGDQEHARKKWLGLVLDLDLQQHSITLMIGRGDGCPFLNPCTFAYVSYRLAKMKEWVRSWNRIPKPFSSIRTDARIHVSRRGGEKRVKKAEGYTSGQACWHGLTWPKLSTRSCARPRNAGVKPCEARGKVRKRAWGKINVFLVLCLQMSLRAFARLCTSCEILS